MASEQNSAKHLRIAILGLPGVGKSSFINFFVDQFWNSENITSLDDSRKRCPSKRCAVLFPSLSKSESLVDCVIFDVPFLSKFPRNSFEEWELGGAIGVRSADVYILMYDVTSKMSFDYVVKVQNEITQSFAHKRKQQSCSFSKKREKSEATPTDDWLNVPQNSRFQNSGLGQFWATTRRRFSRQKGVTPTSSCGLVGLLTTVIEASRPLRACNLETGRHSKAPSIAVVGNKIDIGCNVINQRDANHICKIWRASHFQCSAKYGWNVSAIVRNILEALIFESNNRNQNM